MDEEQLRQRLDEASWSLLGARVIIDTRAREPENLKGGLRPRTGTAFRLLEDVLHFAQLLFGGALLLIHVPLGFQLFIGG